MACWVQDKTINDVLELLVNASYTLYSPHNFLFCWWPRRDNYATAYRVRNFNYQSVVF